MQIIAGDITEDLEADLLSKTGTPDQRVLETSRKFVAEYEYI